MEPAPLLVGQTSQNKGWESLKLTAPEGSLCGLTVVVEVLLPPKQGELKHQ